MPTHCLQGLSLQRCTHGGLKPAAQFALAVGGGGVPGLLHPPCRRCTSCQERTSASLPWDTPLLHRLEASVHPKSVPDVENSTAKAAHCSPLGISLLKLPGCSEASRLALTTTRVTVGLSLRSSTYASHGYLKIEIITTSSLFPAWLEK